MLAARHIRGAQIRTETAPDLAIVPVQLEDALEVLDGLGPLVGGAQDAAHAVHGLDGPRVGAQGVLVGGGGLLGVAQ